MISSNTDDSFYSQEEVAQAIDLARRSPDTHRVVPVYLGQGTADPPYGLRRIHSIWVDTAGGLSGVAAELWKLRESMVQRRTDLPAGRPDVAMTNLIHGLPPRPNRAAEAVAAESDLDEWDCVRC